MFLNFFSEKTPNYNGYKNSNVLSANGLYVKLMHARAHTFTQTMPITVVN